MTPTMPTMPNGQDPDGRAAQQPNEAPTRPSAGTPGSGRPSQPGRRGTPNPTGRRDTISASPASLAPAKSRGPSLFSPRLGLLAALLYNPVVLAAYLLYLYGPVNTCVAGSLCSFGAFPPVVQALLILAGSATLWLLLYALVLRAIEAPGRGSGPVRLLRNLARYERIRELLLVYGALLALLLVVALVTRRLTMPSFVVGSFGLFVCFYCASSTPAESPAPVLRQGGEGRQS